MGTVIKCGGEDSPLGIATALPLGKHHALQSFHDIHAFCTAACPSDNARQLFEDAWGAPGTALLLNERLINCPPQLAPPLQGGLQADLAAAGDKLGGMEQYVTLVRAYRDPDARPGNDAPRALVHATPEGECYHAQARWAFVLGGGKEEGRLWEAGDLQPVRLLLCVDAGGLKRALHQLDSLFKNSMAG